MTEYTVQKTEVRLGSARVDCSQPLYNLRTRKSRKKMRAKHAGVGVWICERSEQEKFCAGVQFSRALNDRIKYEKIEGCESSARD